MGMVLVTCQARTCIRLLNFAHCSPGLSCYGEAHTCLSTCLEAGMLILVLVLKDSLRTFFKSLSLSWSLEVRSLSLSWSLGSGPCPCPDPWGSGPCLYPGPCGLVLVLVLVVSPCKDLFPLFRFIRILL